jgi:hypothetical protein
MAASWERIRAHVHSSEPRYRLHIVPATRRIGHLFLPGWLAITIGRDIWSWRALTSPELAHELCHVRQWQRYGLRFIPRYVRASWRAWSAGGDPYRDNAFEVAARRAAG